MSGYCRKRAQKGVKSMNSSIFSSFLCIREKWISLVRPFLIQSDSASRKRPFSTGSFFTGVFWSFFLSSVESIYSFCGLPRGYWYEGVRTAVLLCCCTAIENRLAALCFARSPRATRASRATNPRPSGLVALDFSRKPPKLRLWHCT